MLFGSVLIVGGIVGAVSVIQVWIGDSPIVLVPAFRSPFTNIALVATLLTYATSGVGILLRMRAARALFVGGVVLYFIFVTSLFLYDLVRAAILSVFAGTFAVRDFAFVFVVFAGCAAGVAIAYSIQAYLRDALSE